MQSYDKQNITEGVSVALRLVTSNAAALKQDKSLKWVDRQYYSDQNNIIVLVMGTCSFQHRPSIPVRLFLDREGQDAKIDSANHF